MTHYVVTENGRFLEAWDGKGSAQAQADSLNQLTDSTSSSRNREP